MGALLFQFFIEALGLSAAIVAFLAWKRSGRRWLATYSAFMLACLFYGAMRNVAYFLKSYVSSRDLEHSLAFFLVYCVGNSIFSFFIFRAGFHISGKRTDKGRKAAIIAFVSAPMAAFAAGAVSCALGRREFLPPLFTASMLMALAAHVAIQVYIAAHYRSADSRLKKRLILVNNFTGGVFLVLSAISYADSFTTAYYIDSFWALNLSYLVLFAGSTAFIAKHVLAAPAPEADPAVVMPKALDGEMKTLVSLIVSGLSNKEIALEIGVPVSAVKNRIYRMFRKHGVQSRTELIFKLSNGGREEETRGRAD